MTITTLVGFIHPIELGLILSGIGYMILYWFNIFPRFNKLVTPLRAIYIFVSALVFIAVFKSVLQYMTWMNDGFAKLFLPPHQSWTYFAIYAGGRFWFAMLLGVLFASAFYYTLRILVRIRGINVPHGHLLLGGMGALIVGWPRFVFYIPLVLLLAVILTVLNILVFKRNEAPLLPAFVIGTIVALLFGTGIINAIGLSVLAV